MMNFIQNEMRAALANALRTPSLVLDPVKTDATVASNSPVSSQSASAPPGDPAESLLKLDVWQQHPRYLRTDQPLPVVSGGEANAARVDQLADYVLAALS